MKHLKLNNIDYVIVRMQKDRKVELVDSEGNLKYVEPEEIKDTLIELKEKSVIPGCIPFKLRDPSFILDLQRRRKELLEQNVKKRAKSRSSAAKSLRPPGSSIKSHSLKSALDSVPPELRDQIASAMNKRRIK